MQIQKGIPIPRLAYFPRNKYPWADMEVGDSFVVSLSTHHTVYKASIYASKRFGFDFTIRKTNEGVRIWRIK